jgi:hypothetical protein
MLAAYFLRLRGGFVLPAKKRLLRLGVSTTKARCHETETEERQMKLEERHIAVLSLLRDVGPKRLSQLNEAAIDDCFKTQPTYHPDDPIIDITTSGLVALAAVERELRLVTAP